MIANTDFTTICDTAFETVKGRCVFEKALKFIDAFSMRQRIEAGVIVGFSGGADSVLLLIFLLKLKKTLNFNLKAVHVNHSIRAAAADSDEDFCRKFCDMLGIDFKSYKINVPELAAKAKKGLEEVAREERYKIFQDELCEKYSCIATAHNSTDNLETFIFNLMRGAGLSGLCGIPPIRDNIIRPILTLPKETILDFLNEAKIPFVTDQTNFSTEYTRNYIRHEIIPKLKSLSHSPEDACAKAIETLRQDNEYLVSAAVASLENCRIEENSYDAYKLSILDFPILARALKLMIKDYGAPSPEKTHIDKIARLLKKGEKFEIYLPGRVSFFSDGKKCYVDSSEKQKSNEGFDIKLNYGINYIPELDIYILLTNDESENISSNVYKLSMQVNIKSAIICGDIGIRTKRDGDTYFYGGITRKVKKLFNDKKIPIEERNRIPVFYDESGIIWIPGFGVRDDGNKESTTHFLKIYKKG